VARKKRIRDVKISVSVSVLPHQLGCPRGIPIKSSSLFYSVSAGDLETVKWFKERGVIINAGCLDEAVREGHWDMVEFLVKSGCPHSWKNKESLDEFHPCHKFEWFFDLFKVTRGPFPKFRTTRDVRSKFRRASMELAQSRRSLHKIFFYYSIITNHLAWYFTLFGFYFYEPDLS
jgi:hypothetical protein